MSPSAGGMETMGLGMDKNSWKSLLSSEQARRKVAATKRQSRRVVLRAVVGILFGPFRVGWIAG